MDPSKLSTLTCCRIEEVRNRNVRLNEGDDFELPGVRLHIKEVTAIEQNGPQCGLVALKMASSLLELENYEVSELFEKAVQLKYTKKGEMFSAFWLSELAKSCWQNASPRVTSFPTVYSIQENILAGNAVLIPYDCDRNHEPTLKKGHTAHWSIVIGYLFTTFANDEIQVVDQISKEANESNFYVFAYHGKSRHMGLWSYASLRASNLQLNEAGPLRTNEEYRIPECGLEQLRDKCLVISRV